MKRISKMEGSLTFDCHVELYDAGDGVMHFVAIPKDDIDLEGSGRSAYEAMNTLRAQFVDKLKEPGCRE
jgi:hypothetical protein